jgi:iron complex transport system substrate-binding protein
VIFLFAIVTTCLISACKGKFSAPTSTSFSPVVPECRIIKHAMGESCVPIHPQRVVVLDGTSLANAIALGIQPIGTPKSSKLEAAFYVNG